MPALAGTKGEPFAQTTKGMRTLAGQVDEARPDTIVVATPHNLRLPKHIGVVMSENSSGKVAEGKREMKLRAKTDLVLGRKVVEEAERVGLPVVEANYGALEGPLSDLAMDWGTLIPLWFFRRGRASRCKVLIVTPARGIPLRQNFEFGRVIGRVAEEYGKNIAFVASSDQAHTHRKDGPYGYSKTAKEYDARIIAAVKRGRLSSIMRIDPGMVRRAKPDSLWQMTILAGVLNVVPMTGRMISYQAPSYYGLLCASFTRNS